MDKVSQKGAALFDVTYAKLLNNEVAIAMDELVMGLRELRNELPHEDWLQLAQRQCLTHPLTQLVHQDPFTRRSFAKPRGYPGDAELLDYIYGTKPLPDTTSSLGVEIYRYTSQAPACQSVRARCDLVATVIDDLAEYTTNPRILAIACGHLREAQRSKAVSEGRLAEYVGLDHDPASLAVIEREQKAHGVKTVCGSVKSLLKSEPAFTNFDFVYSLGLYDYLALSTATALTNRIFSMLKPGGKFLIANFAPGLRDIGYMETFMSWQLIYRDEAEFTKVLSGLPADQIEGKRMFNDQHQNIVFLEVMKR